MSAPACLLKELRTDPELERIAVLPSSESVLLSRRGMTDFRSGKDGLNIVQNLHPCKL